MGWIDINGLYTRDNTNIDYLVDYDSTDHLNFYNYHVN